LTVLKLLFLVVEVTSPSPAHQSASTTTRHY